MKESLIVFNCTSSNIALTLRPFALGVEVAGLASHHRRRRIRQAITNLTVKRSQSIDLVAESGLSIKDIKSNADFKKNINAGFLQIIEETHVFKIADGDIKEQQEPEVPVPVVAPALDMIDALLDLKDEEVAKEAPKEILIDPPEVEEKPKLKLKTKNKKKTFKKKTAKKRSPKKDN